MAQNGMFRNAFRGFNKQDVLQYIDQITAAWDAERKELRELTIEMSEMIKRHDERITEHGTRITAIEQKPSRRWDMVIDKVINAIVAAGVAWLIAKGA